jgi:competence protein ComEC
MGGRCAVAITIAVWLGIALGGRIGTGAGRAALPLAVAFAILGACTRGRTAWATLLIAATLAGSARRAGHERVIEAARARLAAGGDLFRIEAEVVEPPLEESGEPVAIVSVRAADPPLVMGSRLRLRIPAGTGAEWSDRVRALARLDPPPAVRNPGGFDARAAADAGAITASGRAFWARVFPAPGLASWPRATLARWRRAIQLRLDRGLDPAARELVVPLVIGDRSALSPALNGQMRAAGIIHLLALSGLHVAWMAAIARGLAATLAPAPAARPIAGALCALLYVGLAGPIPSLVRAAATELVGSVARLASRPLDSIQALAISALVPMIVSPGWASDLGFQLSCAATLGLATIASAIPAPHPRTRFLIRAFTPTIGAQVVALPLLIGAFHSLSTIAPLANLLAVPISGWLLTAAWLGVTLDLAVPGSGHAAFSACAILGDALRWVAARAASLPGGLVPSGGHGAIVALAAGGAILLAWSTLAPRDLAARARPRTYAREAALWAGALATSLALTLTISGRPLLPPERSFWVVVLDVGQGDAIAVAFPDGWWLVDAGARSNRYDAGENVVVPFLRWAGVRRLDALVLTHDDGDHVGGARAVLNDVGARSVLASPSLPGVPGPGPRFGARAIARGEVLREDPAARVLWPPRSLAECAADSVPSPSSDNTAALVIQLGEGRGRVLLTADVDSTVERALAVDPPIELLKVAHHGSGSSSGASFLARARPLRALISCGRRNPFGHPDPGTLARLRAAGAATSRTDREGALWFEIGIGGARRIDWKRGAPGWSGSDEERRLERSGLRGLGSHVASDRKWI